MIQYFHKRKYADNHLQDDYSLLARGGETFALVLPELKLGDTHMLLGMAKCHPDDNYNKVIGRDIATGRMAFVPATIVPGKENCFSIFVGYFIIKVRNNRLLNIIYL